MMVEEDKDESPHVNTDETDEEAQNTCLAFDDDYKGTSVCFLTSPLFSYSSPVHMYSISSPLYYLQGLHSKANDLHTHSPMTLQKLTPGCRRLPDSLPARTSAALDEPRTHWDRSM
jgi:hypothetical protein